MHSFLYRFNDTELLFCNDTERHKGMRKAGSPLFLSFSIKVKKKLETVLKFSGKKPLLNYETTT